MTQWLWSYISSDRGARLITGLRTILEPPQLGRRDDDANPASAVATLEHIQPLSEGGNNHYREPGDQARALQQPAAGQGQRGRIP